MSASVLWDAPQSSERRPAPRAHRWAAPRAFTVVCLIGLAVGTSAVGTSAEGWSGWLPWLRAGGHAVTQGHAPPLRAAGELPMTAPDPQWAAFAGQRALVDPRFAGYYAAHLGATLLGPAITPAFPSGGGWLQIFTAGALFAPGPPAARPRRQLDPPDDPLDRLVRALPAGDAGVRASDGVARLPLLDALLAAGSTLHAAGDASSLTYVDLRAAEAHERLIPAPDGYSTSQPTGPAGTFVPEDERGRVTLGHLIPAAFLDVMRRSQVGSGAWLAELGPPLTEALPAVVWRDGQAHQVSLQLFERGGLVLDTTAAASAPTGNPALLPLSVGLDYLETFGPPTTTLASGTPLWAAHDLTIDQAPGAAGGVAAQARAGFAARATGQAAWLGGALWYQVAWRAPGGDTNGWVPAAAVRYTAGDSAWRDGPLTWASLNAYVASLGDTAGYAVYDVTRGEWYGANQRTPFIMASSSKVPIMLTLLSETEAQKREPNAEEMALLTTMIENSNNDAAQALFEEIGGAPAMAAFLRRAGVSGIAPNADAWGYSTATPRAMVQLLALLYGGRILTAADRALALRLMEQVEPDERIGVGDTAPAGAVVALKDGWVPGPDGLWVVNSSGIVYAGGETYIIAVYTQHDSSLGAGWSTTQEIASAVARLVA